VQAAITANTHSILTVDLYGQTSDMDAICNLAKEYGIYTFADSAQGHGAKYKGRRTGSHCDASCFSFYPSKNLGALGEAGAVVTNNEALAEKVRLLRNYGSRNRYYNEYKGFNERMDPVQASFLRCKIPDLDELNAKRSLIADRYMEDLSHLHWLTLPLVPEWSTPCWHLFVVNAHKHRDALAAHLKSHNVDCIIHYPVPPHLQKCYQDLGHDDGSFPVAEKLAKGVLSIPICPTLTPEQINHVISTVSSFKPDESS
jgi:dTDP-4-amino-4,6-dideoxygalactose transaminase